MTSKQRPHSAPNVPGTSYPRTGSGTMVNGKEERDAANLAKRKRDTFDDAEDPKKLLKFTSWEQTNKDVTVVLFAGKKISPSEVTVDFLDSAVRVSLTDGRKWKCLFYGEIEKKASRLQLQKMRIFLKVTKLFEATWPSFEREEGTAPFKPPSKVKKSKSKASTPQPSGGVTKHTCNGARQKDIADPCSHGDHSMPVTAADPSTTAPVTAASAEKVNGSVSEDAARCEKQVSSPILNQVSPDSTATDDAQESLIKEEDEVYDLNHIKYDFYESAQDSITVTVYIKQIMKDSVKIDLQQKEFSVIFQTIDKRFLSMYEGTSEDTKFRWHVNVVSDLDVPRCKYKVKTQSIELALKKDAPHKWGALEASQTKDAMVKQSEGWMSTSKQKEKATTSIGTEEQKSKVIFDELENVKTSRDRTAEWLDKQGPSISGTCYTGQAKSKDTVQKPTCLVSPLGKSTDVSVVTPGYTGLDNLGNTCFMNSSLQVLANTTQLRDYFTDGSFQREINQDNVLGTGGKLAVMFAMLMKILWAGTHHSYAPSKLKTLVAMKWNQFMGYAQHDAQEFMAFLLDGLHEDVNRVRDKPYTEQVDSDGRPDEVVANEAWERHKKRNDSFIVDLFQGQYKSKLVCPVCSKVSITFDPFMIMPVPLPKKQRLLPITFFSQDVRRKPVKFMLRLPQDATVEQLKEQMHHKTRVDPKQLRVFEVYKNRVHMFFGKGDSLKNVQATDKLFVCEVLSPKIAGESVLELCVVQRTEVPTSTPLKCSMCHRDVQAGSKLKRCTKCFRTAYCDRNCQSQDWTRHKPNCREQPELIGQPFIISIPESKATYLQLCQLMEVRARYSLDIFQPPVGSLQESREATPPVDSDLATPTSSPSSSPPQLDENDQNLSCVSIQKNASSASCTMTSGGDSLPSYDTVDAVKLDNESQLKTDDMSSKGDSGIDTMSLSSAQSSSQGHVNESRSSEGHNIGERRSPPTGYVVGRQQDLPGCIPIPFSLRPCDKDGRNLRDNLSRRLENLGEEALDLRNVYYLAMDWKNKEKSVPCVMVQAKILECDDDNSVDTLTADEAGPITLEQCMSLFTEPDVLSPDNTWYCPQCKEHREATKQMSLWRLPQTLIIQLKRFSFRNLLWRDKIDKLVQFPIRNLDLRPYYVGTGPSDEPAPVYDLYGVVNHYGGILGGHYTAFARCPDLNDPRRSQVDWRLFDDSMVSSTSENQVVTRGAYVLFYRRRQMTLNPVPQITPSQSDTASLNKESDASDEEFCDAQESCPITDYFLKHDASVSEDDGIGADDEELDEIGGPPLVDDIRFATDNSDSDSDKDEDVTERQKPGFNELIDKTTDSNFSMPFTDMDAVD